MMHKEIRYKPGDIVKLFRERSALADKLEAKLGPPPYIVYGNQVDYDEDDDGTIHRVILTEISSELGGCVVPQTCLTIAE